MPSRIEDYAVVGNCETLALIGRDGSIDWVCLPRFDSSACFSALLGGPEHGRWLIAPAAADAKATRRYRGDTLILETRIRNRTRRRDDHRFHEPPRRRFGHGADRARPARSRGDAHRTRGALRLWLRRALGGAPGRRPPAVHRRPGSPVARHQRAFARRGYAHRRRLCDRRRPRGQLRPDLVAILSRAARAYRRGEVPRSGRGVLDGVGGASSSGRNTGPTRCCARSSP